MIGNKELYQFLKITFHVVTDVTVGGPTSTEVGFHPE